MKKVILKSYLGKFVFVTYDGSPYLGFVRDIVYDDIYVSCMHRIGRKEDNCFFWLRKIVDECRYTLEHVLAIIPQPEKIDRRNSHFKIYESIWKRSWVKK